MSGFGIDIYQKYQVVTDWTAVKNFRLQSADGPMPISFMMIKGTDGGGKAMVPADSYVAGAKSIGMSVGLYHYAQLSPTPEEQADILIGEVQRLAAYGEDPALDLEAPFAANADALDFGARFLNHMIGRGYRPQLYWNNVFDSALRSQMEARVNGFVKWIARYGALPTTPGYDTHQYSSTLQISGISASGVDGDWAYTDNHISVVGGPQPLPPGGGTGNQEEEDMSSDYIIGAGTDESLPFQEMIVPLNGHRYLRIADGWGATTILGGISLVDDTPGSGIGSNVKTVQPGGVVDADRPGPWDLSVAGGANYANYSHVSILAKAPVGSKVVAWTNDLP